MLAESQILHSKLRKGDCRAENAKKREEGYVREKTGKKGKASSFLMSITLDFCVLLFFGWQRVLGEMFSFFFRTVLFGRLSPVVGTTDAENENSRK